MYSKEGEYVALTKPCDCTGPVEQWLNMLIDAVRDTLRAILGEAVGTYGEIARYAVTATAATAA
jgi:dynein heavy chain